MGAYLEGQIVHITAAFTDSAGTAYDPTVVKFKFETPAGVDTTYTYLADIQIVRSSVGHYYIDLDVTAAGFYKYRWYSTGTGKTAEEGAFELKASAL
jgi:hypothetical protein